MTQPNENWYQCDGECDDERNREFAHGFGSRYKFPLPEVDGAPVPSQMGDNQKNYKAKNVAWMIEMFAGILGVNKSDVSFRYENNQPKERDKEIETPLTDTELPTKDGNIIVRHPGGSFYPSEEGSELNGRQMVKSPELERYEQAAKKSALLKLYQDNSPAKIEYFKT